MTASDWISLGSSIGALSAALVALFTLLELSRQRKSAYKPDLCVLKMYFDVKPGFIGQISNVPFTVDWVPQELTQPKTTYFTSIRIVNVGFGAAKNIKAKWEFDFNSIIEEVNQMAQKTFQDFYLCQNEHQLSIASKGTNHYSVNNKMDLFQIEYLLPSASQPNGHDIYLPPAYVLLVSAYLFLCVKEKRQFSEIRVPIIKLALSYADIGKERHNSKHKLECRIIFMTSPSEDNTHPQFGIEYAESSE